MSLIFMYKKWLKKTHIKFWLIFIWIWRDILLPDPDNPDPYPDLFHEAMKQSWILLHVIWIHITAYDIAKKKFQSFFFRTAELESLSHGCQLP